jgi:scyllo-inositol 2-dehydrogenase (NADP+)
MRLGVLSVGVPTGADTALRAALAAAGWDLRAGTDADAVLVLAPEGVPREAEEPLRAAGVPMLVVSPQPGQALADAAGLVLGRLLPTHEVRVRPGPDAGEVTARWAGDLLLDGAWPLVDKTADDVEVLLTANSAFRDHPVATWRPATRTGLLTVASAYDEPALHRLLVRLLRRALGLQDPRPVRLGMLGYGAIGHEHAAAVAEVPGLELAVVCDRDPSRVEAARAFSPDVRGVADGNALLEDDGVDLVVVSTPPNTHADWVLRALQAGKSVVVEKPFCLTVEEADRQVAAAADAGLLLAVYQNRRWDADYLALKQVVRSGRIGEVFHLETFVGGYDHPCNYWHSDAEVSGGAIYDWGSHYLDWVLDLLPQQVEWVSATAHKRVWHDVTNADHTRVLLHLEGGVEAEFTHSDLAAVRKPKFYVLGTRGGVLGHWQQERVVSRSPVGLVVEDRFAVSDAPARLELVDADGSSTALAVPTPPAQPFHRELADALLSGIPMTVTPAGSRRNIAVMQAATQSAAEGGRPVAPPA